MGNLSESRENPVGNRDTCGNKFFLFKPYAYKKYIHGVSFWVEGANNIVIKHRQRA